MVRESHLRRRMISEETWLDAWLWYRGAPHQEAAVRALYQRIARADPSLLQDDAAWLQAYRSRDKLVKDFMHPEGT